MNKILNSIKKELERNIDLNYKKGATRYFKETVTFIGVRTPIVRNIARKIAKNYKNLRYEETIKLCEELLKKKYFEYGIIAFTLMDFYKKKFNKDTFKIFESWLNKYVDNWAWCDFLCTDLIYSVIEKYPDLILKVEKWAYSKNRWLRRASAVSFVRAGNRGLFLKDILKIASILLEDKDDLVQKGVGWMLKETTKSKNKDTVIKFIETNKRKMPRTMLRYAIEKLSEEKRKEILRSSK
ncbi:MAG: DNA alkylation repair protein [archaeon]